MCGINGMLAKDGRPVDEGVLSAMCEALAHRGPDGAGTWSRGSLGFGHRRLAIIDLDSGAQPMSNHHGTLWITYNGEIYNFRQLKKELEGLGHRFRTRSDTEVIIHAYQEWGAACVERFRGMFAFAIADLDSRRLFLARDHLGIKPLYWVDTPECFAFASEIQSLHRIPEIGFDIDLEAVDQYLSLQYVPAPRSVYRQVNKLRPGHRMWVGFDGKVAPPERYWSLCFEADHSRSEDEWLGVLDDTLRASVAAHMVADVPFGAFLSGGVDSSAVVAYMSQILDRPLKTFTIGFEEPDYDEAPFAAAVAERWQTDHHLEVLQPDAAEILPRLVRHYGEPFGDSSAIPTYYVSSLASSSVPMVLSGDGGDELFAGYHSYRAWMRWLQYDGTPAWKRTLYPVAHLLRPQRYLKRVADLESWMSFIQYMPLETRRRLWKKEHRPLCRASFEPFVEEFDRASSLPPLQRAQSLDLNTYLPFAILTKVDVASMISSLEVRTPLVDHRVAELVATMPPELNFRRNDRGELEGKLLLKRLLSRYYPEDFLRRPKAGFGIPVHSWFGPRGSLNELVHDQLLTSDALVGELFERRAIRRLLRDNAAAPCGCSSSLRSGCATTVSEGPRDPYGVADLR